MRGHAAGLGADEADEIGAVDHAVGALARIGADHADRQWMIARDRILAVERGRDRNLQRLRQRNQLRRRARGAHAAAGDDHRPLGLLQQLDALPARSRGPAPDGTAARARSVASTSGSSSASSRSICPSLPRNCRCTGPGVPDTALAERLPHHVGKARDVVDGGIELGHRLECRHVIDLLIDLAEFRLRLAPAGERDHRRMREPGIAQAGGEIERADHLRHADAGLAGSARIAVRHIGRGLSRRGYGCA